MGRESSPRAKKPGTIHSDGLETVQYCPRYVLQQEVTRKCLTLYTVSMALFFKNPTLMKVYRKHHKGP